jgi:hypothetical protein
MLFIPPSSGGAAAWREPSPRPGPRPPPRPPRRLKGRVVVPSIPT